MTDSRGLLISIGAAAGATLALHLWSHRGSLVPPLPTSPKSYPIIGNLLSMPQNPQHIGFMELEKQLGSKIFSLSVLGMVIITLNSVEDATNLLEKRSNIYSDRVFLPMLSDPSLVDFGSIMTMLPYNDRWRTNRRLIHPWLHQKGVIAFRESQQQEARNLLRRLVHAADNLECSEQLYAEFSLSLARTLARSIYGYQLESTDDPFLLGMQKVVEIGAKGGMPTNFLVNVFPFLRHVPEWFPGAKWKQTAREWRSQYKEVIQSSYNWTKSRTASGDHEASKSIVASIISQCQQLGLSPDEIDDNVSHIATTLFGGGTDTSANFLLIFALAMTLYPETQRKAQEEIDSVIGRDRLPIVEDRAGLPYTNRLIQELMRWCPVFPTGIPHACGQDDVYQGYKIPKGAIIIGNIWAMSRDEKYYKNPERFDPDRFLDSNIPPCPSFGFGRRLCPGLHYAETSLFIFVASMLATLNFGTRSDEDGQTIVPKLDSDNSLMFHPKPFKLKLNPRSAHHAGLAEAGS